MNSVDRHLGAATKAATLLAMRSARKDIILVVEGDTDVELFANTLGIPRSNILSCDGKEVLMSVYKMGPTKGIDPRSIFIRDRDHDSVVTGVNNGVLILVTIKYDIEMELLSNRLFGRILGDYLKETIDYIRTDQEFAKICRPAAYIGALRLYSSTNKTGIDFDDIKYTKFINQKSLELDVGKMVNYMFAKSRKALSNQKAVTVDVKQTVASGAINDIACSKEFLDILSLALSKHYDACCASECSAEVLSRTVRVAACNEDIKMMPFYAEMKNHIEHSGSTWNGLPL